MEIIISKPYTYWAVRDIKPRIYTERTMVCTQYTHRGKTTWIWFTDEETKGYTV